MASASKSAVPTFAACVAPHTLLRFATRRRFGFAAVRKRGDPHARTGKVARGLAHHTGPLGADAETRFAWSTDRRDRARDQEPAQFRQQFLKSHNLRPSASFTI